MLVILCMLDKMDKNMLRLHKYTLSHGSKYNTENTSAACTVIFPAFFYVYLSEMFVSHKCTSICYRNKYTGYCDSVLLLKSHATTL